MEALMDQYFSLWLVLYAITADNVPMSERMEAVIDCMFHEHLQTL